MTISPSHIDRAFQAQVAVFTPLPAQDLAIALRSWVLTAEQSMKDGSMHTFALMMVKWLTDRIVNLLT